MQFSNAATVVMPKEVFGQSVISKFCLHRLCFTFEETANGWRGSHCLSGAGEASGAFTARAAGAVILERPVGMFAALPGLERPLPLPQQWIAACTKRKKSQQPQPVSDGYRPVYRRCIQSDERWGFLPAARVPST